MYKFFVKEEQIENEYINICGKDVNHINNVLRLQVKDKILVTNQEIGVTYNCEITEINKDKVVCKIFNKVEKTTESSINVTLFQGLPKADKMEYIIQKTTELGVKKIVPVCMNRCIVKLDEKDSLKKLERWKKIAQTASEQSKRDIIPQIGGMEKLKNICQYIDDFDLFLVAYENEKTISLKNILNEFKTQANKTAVDIAIVIGPEGGLEEQEIELLYNSGAKIVSLGKTILRTETAPIVMLGNIIYELDD